ncbi:hypothetical protein CEE69_22905 [Rhodopirellula bahusiensis]|uniref:Uncharacterized protein n=1 Tax=Rhodopirellula bahusiensis TaxID=2014065 RepID=A0A2G1W200_9BACT|nr:hypothetical protein CEE69_22905 [Rhodopirellula bahusiensis]
MFLERDDLSRAFMIQSLNQPELSETMPYMWKGESFFRFWNATLDLEVTTLRGTLDESQNHAVLAATGRDAPTIKTDSLDQIAAWFNATYANHDIFEGDEIHNAPLRTHDDVLAKVSPPRVVLDFSETSVPGRLELHFPWRTHDFCDFDVKVNLWAVQTRK